MSSSEPRLSSRSMRRSSPRAVSSCATAIMVSPYILLHKIYDEAKVKAVRPRGYDEAHGAPLLPHLVVGLLFVGCRLDRFGRSGRARSWSGSEVRCRTHQALHDRSWSVCLEDFHLERAGAGVLQSGRPDDVCVREARCGALISRSVEERPGVRDVLLGRRLGVGIVFERTDVERTRAV